MNSALLSAFENNDMSALEALVKGGAEVDERLSDGYTLLMLASGTENVHVVNLLLSHGADPNLKNDGGSTALKLAALKGHSAILKLLLAGGADPNLKDEKGFTPLMYTAMNGDLAIVKLLLGGGANPAVLSERGKKTAREFALEKGHAEAAKELETRAAPQAPTRAKDREILAADLIGQQRAKEALEQVIAVARVNQERVKRGLKPLSLTLHAVFSGNPGTGKTTFARFYAQEIKRLGLLKQGHLIEVTRQDLVAEFIGQTAAKTAAVVKKALGGILFIDEAYSLKNAKEDSFGQECIDTLIKLIEDHREDFILILAGYTDEMRAFLHLNPGLKSRIPNEIFFEDFTFDELGKIFDQFLKKNGFVISPEDRQFAMEQIALKKRGRSFGNAREVRNLFERALAQQSTRLGKLEMNRLSEVQLCTLIYSDLTEARSDEGARPHEDSQAESVPPALKRLQQLVGLQSVKREIEELANFVRVTRLRSQRGDLLSDVNLHMIFTGNPGTGKTTVARLLGEIFKEMDILPGGHTVETDRSGLVSGYLGQTALKTKEKLEDALGGVLLVDEAYTLHRGRGSEDSYGQEAIDTLLKFMEDYRGKLVVALSGYPEEMEIFLNSNPGLKSRFGRILRFEDFKLDELCDIGKRIAEENGFALSPSALQRMGEVLKSRRETERIFANAREVRNLLETAFKKHAGRIVKMGAENAALDPSLLNTLQLEDF